MIVDYKLIDSMLASRQFDELRTYVGFSKAQFAAGDIPVKLLLSEARLLHLSEAWEEAALAWQRVLDVRPGDREASLKLGKSLTESNRYEESLAPLRRALSHEGAWEHAAFLLARSLTALGRNEEAVSHWRDLAQRTLRMPKSAQMWFRSAFGCKRFDEAVDAIFFGLYHDIDMNVIDDSIVIALCRLTRERTADELSRLPALRPQGPIGELFDIVLLARAGQLTEANSLLSRVPRGDKSETLRLVSKFVIMESAPRGQNIWAVLTSAVEAAKEGLISNKALGVVLCRTWSALYEQGKSGAPPADLWLSVAAGNLIRLGKLNDAMVALNAEHYPEVALGLHESVFEGSRFREATLDEACKALRALGRHEEAVAIMAGRAGELSSAMRQAFIDSLIQSEQFDKAIQCVEEGVGLGDKKAEDAATSYARFLNLCKIYAGRRDWHSLERYAKILLTVSPLRAEGYLHLGIAYINLVRPEDASIAFDAGLFRNPNNVGLLMNAATAARTCGNIAVAERLLKEALTVEIKGASLLSLIGDYLRNEAGEGEFEAFLSIIEAGAGSPVDKLTAKCCLMFEQGLTLEIMELLKAHESDVRDDHRLACVLARAYLANNRAEEACHILETHYMKREGMLEVSKEYMTALLDSGKFESAERVLVARRHVFRSTSTLVATVNPRMNLNLVLGKFSDAWSVYKDTGFVKALGSAFTRLNRRRVKSYYQQQTGASTANNRESSVVAVNDSRDIEAGEEGGPGFREFRAIEYVPSIVGDRGDDISPVRQGSMLVCAMQGVGDEIRYASLYRDIGKVVPNPSFTCDPRLSTLLRRSFPDYEFLPTVRRDQGVMGASMLSSFRGLPDLELSRLMDRSTFDAALAYDAVVPISDFVEQLRSNVDSFDTGQTPYLLVDSGRAKLAKRALRKLSDRPKIGISWRSGNARAIRSMHYTRLTDWGPIFTIRGIDFINLMHDECVDEVRDAEERFGIKIHTLDIDLKNDFEAAASLVSELDLVVAPCVTIAELSAAVGTQTLYMWRVPAAKWRMHPTRGHDMWHGAGVPIFATPIGDTEALIAETAKAIEARVSRRQVSVA